jgi:speckle-type POZ protein
LLVSSSETFAADRLLLATPSPVFMAQLFSQMKAKTASHIGIDDIEPRVFRAKLHFVYTDSLLDMDSGGDALAVAQHLVVAADKYGTERLKLILWLSIWLWQLISMARRG